MSATDPRIAELADLRRCATRLGMAFGAAAEAARGTDEWLEYFRAFDRCFFSARVGVALEMRLARAGASVERAEPRSDREDLLDRETLADPPEREETLRYTERERDREVERVSFPILIRALERVAEDAPALRGREAADLPTLRELLVRVKAQQPSRVATAPAPAPSLRARLTGSAAATAGVPERRPASNVGEVLAARRATGPPKRF